MHLDAQLRHHGRLGSQRLVRNLAYAPTSQVADQALAAKAAMMAELGIHVHLCGD